MNSDKKKLLTTFLKANVAPLLIDFFEGIDIKNAVILPSNIDLQELNGDYMTPPDWLNKLNIINKQLKFLIIDKIDSISCDEQLKFYEILKYRQISTFALPNDCRIIVTSHHINQEKINDKIFSLVVVI